jgi:SAM-dependent methyltransferase
VTERERLAAAARRGPVLDLACGRGRHALAAAELGARVVGIDRDAGLLAELLVAARGRSLPVWGLRADLETSNGIPVRAGSCSAILVFCFLFRPLAPAICEALAPGGLLLYETFTVHQPATGHSPRNRAFLLEDGELPALFPELEILRHWEGLSTGPHPTALARISARKATQR